MAWRSKSAVCILFRELAEPYLPISMTFPTCGNTSSRNRCDVRIRNYVRGWPLKYIIGRLGGVSYLACMDLY